MAGVFSCGKFLRPITIFKLICVAQLAVFPATLRFFINMNAICFLLNREIYQRFCGFKSIFF